MREYFNENGPTGVPPQEQWSVDDIVRFESHAFAVQKVMDVFLRLVRTFLSLSVDFLIRWTPEKTSCMLRPCRGRTGAYCLRRDPP